MDKIDVFKDLGITKYINAHDTYTVYGGSRMDELAIEAMNQIRKHFVDFNELEEKVGKAIAKITDNEDCFITNGAAGALTLTAAVCMCGDNPYYYQQLPTIVDGVKDEFILLKCQRNAYDKSLQATGARIIEVGDADETLDFELEGRINERTAAIVYFENRKYAQGSMPLEDVVRIAKKRNIPVILDVAALLPPKKNLSVFSKMGVDYVIFSGGKSLAGPQDSGLVFASSKNVELMRKFGAPNHGICRGSKVSRESIVALYYAVKIFLARDENVFAEQCLSRIERIRAVFIKHDIPTEIVYYGPVGQAYVRLKAEFGIKERAKAFRESMLAKHIYVGQESTAIMISPVNVNEEEVSTLLEAIENCL